MVGTMLVAGLVVLLGVLVVLWIRDAGLKVSMDVPLLETSVDLDPLVFDALGKVQGAELTDSSHGRFTLSIRSVPGWAVVAMILTFPFGLLFLLVRVPREHLHIAVVPTAQGGQALRFTGETRRQVWRRVCRALAPLMQSEPTAFLAERSRR